jgi:hypothetical protein
MTLGADRLASGGEKTFDVKVNGKKSAQVNVGGMSLQIFEKKGKPPTKTYLYQNMAAWQETAKGFELTMSDDVEYQFSCKEGEGAEICELITLRTTELAAAMVATAPQAIKEEALEDESNLESKTEAVDTDEGDTSGGDDFSMGLHDSDSFTNHEHGDDAIDLNTSDAAESMEQAILEWQSLSIEEWFTRNGAGDYVKSVRRVFEGLETMDQIADVYDFEDETADELMEAFGMDQPMAARLWGLLEQMKASGGAQDDIADSGGPLHDFHSDDSDDDAIDGGGSGTDEDDME